MPDHAILSASGAHRWLNCTPSARYELEFEERTSDAAEEGSAAHALCEHKLKRKLKKRSQRPVSEWDDDEMEECTDDYVSFVLEQFAAAKQRCNDPLILIEEHLDFSCYVPEGFGTGDCVIIADDNLHIIDFKYGRGVLVNAENNPQMKLYALGALSVYEGIYDIDTVSLTIFQPRRDNVSTWTVPVSELKGWAETELKTKAVLAFNGEGEYTPGEWCMFCRGASRCRARANASMSIIPDAFQLPPTLSDAEIEELLPKLPAVIKWAKGICAYATDEAVNHGKHWNGFKLVPGKSKRKFTDEKAVEKAAIEAGYTDIYRKSMITLTAMEKLMGKTGFNQIVGKYITRVPGNPTLEPDTSDKDEITNANTVFEVIKEEK